ncbi:hypothetical protein BDR26DRAFT_856778 [Obelidium mucronatum]|nr:hypothetical protein BDR26DRAFT_856778 [Obelidium mucronatum]
MKVPPRNNSAEGTSFFLLHTPIVQICSGLSLIAASLFPRKVGLLLGIAIIAYPVGKLILQSTKVIPHKRQDDVRKGRHTAKIDGDFVVFLIGARYNSPTLSNDFKEMGEAMSEMVKELEASDPEKSGFLGVENYWGDPATGSTTLQVQFWRSAEHLHDWSVSKMSAHYSPWKKTMTITRKNPDLGIWHETFIVRNGEYEAIYVNMPPIGLGRATELEPVSKSHVSMMQRLGRPEGENNVPASWREEAASY